MPPCALRIAWVVFKPWSRFSSSRTFLACSSLVSLSRRDSVWSIAVVNRCLISCSLEIARWMRVSRGVLASCRSRSFRNCWVGAEAYECVVRPSTLFDALPWFEWGWELGEICMDAWDWDCWDGRAVLRRRREAMRGGGVYGQSWRKEVALSRRESLACICFFNRSRTRKEYVGKNELLVEGNVKVRLPRGHRWFVI